MSSKENWYHYIQDLHQFVETQNEKVNELEKKMKELKEEVNTLKQNKPINVEKIEYKFDQLKVERLDGTLTIGLTPNGAGNIEDFTVENQTMQDVKVPNTKYQEELAKRIEQNISQYFDQEVDKDFDQLEKKHGQNLDKNYRQFIIDDIRRQLDQRIHIYMNQIKADVQTDNVSNIEKTISDKLLRDIQQAIDSFVKQLPRKE